MSTMPTERPWIIKDWAGNRLFGRETFPTFEDGWDRIYAFVADEFPDADPEEVYGEYFVEQG